MSDRIIYLDCNATTPCAAEVVEAMLPFLSDEYANPSSTHTKGRRAHRHVETAREQVARLVGARASEILFTAGATESNNIALLGLIHAKDRRRTILCSAVEHKSVLETGRLLAVQGVQLRIVPVDGNAVVRLDRLHEMLDNNIALVSLHLANNEVGTIQPVARAAAMARQAGALVHCDAAQAVGKIDCLVDELDVDLASFSAHKFYGPKGVGALYVRSGLARKRLRAILGGGGQELGLRPGTLNVPGIVGMGRACAIAAERLPEESRQLTAMRDCFEEGVLRAIEGTSVAASGANRLPNTTSITIPGLPVDVLMANLPQVCISSGSACTSGAVVPSHVLLAMGMDRDSAECTFRASFGRMNTPADVDAAIQAIVAVTARLRCGSSCP